MASLPTCSILALGKNAGVDAWKDAVEGQLGFSLAESVISPDPTDKQFKKFFASNANWIYIGGHGGHPLDDEAPNNLGTFQYSVWNDDQNKTNRGLSLLFGKASLVTARRSSDPPVLAQYNKGSSRFGMDKSCDVAIFASCTSGGRTDTIAAIRTLFAPKLLLCFASIFRPKVIATICGKSPADSVAPSGTPMFPDRLDTKNLTLEAVRTAWLESIRDHLGDSKDARGAVAIDENGQSWRIVDAEIVKGKKY